MASHSKEHSAAAQEQLDACQEGDEFENPVTSDWERTTLALLEDGDKWGFHTAISDVIMNNQIYFDVANIDKVDDGDNQLKYAQFRTHFDGKWDERMTQALFNEIKGDSQWLDTITVVAFQRYVEGPKRARPKPPLPKLWSQPPLETDDGIAAVARAAAAVIQAAKDEEPESDGKLEEDKENLETVKETLLSILTAEAPLVESTDDLCAKVSSHMLETAESECRNWTHVFCLLEFFEVLRLFAVIMFCRKLHVASEWRIGTMIASNFLVRGCVGMALSLASDSCASQHTFERFWLAQMCALVLGFALEAFAVNFAMFCVGFMLTAFGPNHELLLVYVNRMLPPNSAERVLAPKNVRMCVAAALAPAISGTLAHFLGRREPFLAAFVCGIALILVSLRLVGKEITTKDELFHRYCGRLEAADAASIGTQTLSTFICALTAYMLATSVLLAMIVWHAHFGKEHCDANMFESGFQVSLLLLVIAALSVPHSSIVQMRKELATLWLLAALSAAALMAVAPMVDRLLGHVGFWFMLPAAAVCLAPVAAVCQRLMDAVQISEAMHASVFCAPRIFCVALCKAVVCVVIANWYNRKHTVAFKVASVSLMFASIPALVQLTSFKEETVPQTKDYVKL